MYGCTESTYVILQLKLPSTGNILYLIFTKKSHFVIYACIICLFLRCWRYINRIKQIFEIKQVGAPTYGYIEYFEIVIGILKDDA